MTKPSKLRKRFARKARRLELAARAPQIMLATPAGDHVMTCFHRSVVHMVAHSLAEGLKLGHVVSQYSILCFSRQWLAMHAIEKGCTHVLFIDSDMEFPSDLALRLVAHNVPIVGVSCMARRKPYYLTGRTEEEREIVIGPDTDDLVKAHRVGTGVMLIHTDVFKALEMPWFDFTWLPEKSCFRGEDFYFCDKAREAGFDIYIDRGLSREVNHVGTFGYNPLLRQGFEEARREEEARLAAKEQA